MQRRRYYTYHPERRTIGCIIKHDVNIPDFLTSTITFRKRASQKMKISSDPISQYTVDKIDLINGKRLQRLSTIDTTTPKSAVRRQRKERLSKQKNGHFIVTTFISKTEDWIWTKKGTKGGWTRLEPFKLYLVFFLLKSIKLEATQTYQLSNVIN